MGALMNLKSREIAAMLVLARASFPLWPVYMEYSECHTSPQMTGFFFPKGFLVMN